jgi:hypothetical protein
MKTSQSAFENTDGSTTFYTYTNNPDRLTCATMASDPSTLTDGTLGRKLFYEYRGYTVTDCYNQKTDNNEGGFTYAMFKAEIDAGRPVMLNLVGHTVVGVGYDDSTNTVYIHDTWDYSNHTMIWGGSYSGMALRSVSIVNIQSTIKSTRIYLPLVVRALPGSPPGSFNKSAPSNGTTSQPANPTLSWSASSNATSYEYCLDTSNNAACDATWISTGTSTSAGLSNLSPATSYYWQVHAKNSFGTVDADGGTWWSFTTTGSPPSNGIVNGDFETGSTGWTEYSYQGWSIILNSGFPGSVTPHSGSWVAWLGGDDDEIAYIQQQVTISAGAPYLSYYHWIASEDFCGYDFGEVLINGILVNDYSLCSDNNTGGWVKHSVNLSAYAGQSVTLRIGVETDSAFNSNLFIDDVSLQASLSASGQIDGILPHLDASTSLGKAGIVTQGEKPQGIREILLMITR